MRKVAPAEGVDSTSAPAHDSAPSDAVIALALRRGDRDAALALFDRYGDLALRIVTRILGPDPELQDVHHDVFVRALSSAPSLTSPDSLQAWISSIAVHAARALIQRRVRRRWLRLFPATRPPDLPLWPAPDHVREALRATYLVLDQLPADERIAFTLRRFDGMDLLDIASACNVSLATVKRRLTRADREFRALASQRPELQEWLEMEDVDDHGA